MGARPETLDIHVPEEKGLVDRRVELDDLVRLRPVMLVEQQQLDRRGVPRKDRKIDAGCIRDGPQGMGAAGGGGIGGETHCRGGVGFRVQELRLAIREPFYALAVKYGENLPLGLSVSFALWGFGHK